MKPGPASGYNSINRIYLLQLLPDTHTRLWGLRQVLGPKKAPGVVPKSVRHTHDDVDSRQLCLPARKAGWGWRSS